MSRGWFLESRRHSLSSRGIKTAQKIPRVRSDAEKSEKGNPVFDLISNNYGVYETKTVGGRELDLYMQKDLDLKNHIDYEFVTNQTIDGELVGVLFLMSFKGKGRWDSSLGKKGFSRTTVKDLAKKDYTLFDNISGSSSKGKQKLIPFSPAIRKGQWSKISERENSQFFQTNDYGLDIHSPDGENWKVTLNKAGMGIKTLYFGRNPTDARIKAEVFMKNTATPRLLDMWESDFRKGYVR